MRTKCLPYLLIFGLFMLGYSCKKDKAGSTERILNISRTTIQVGNDVGFTDMMVVQSNVNWTVSLSAGAETWLSVDPVTKAAGDSTILTIRVMAANTSPVQTATLTITPTGSDLEPRQVNITRKAYGLVWQKCYGGSDDDEIFATALVPNGQLVTTGYSLSTDGDALGNTGNYYFGWVLKAGSDGSRLWQKATTSGGSTYVSIAASPDGSTVSTGDGSNTNRARDIFAAKYDGNGSLLWNRSYGGSSDEIPRHIINTADGGYLISGETNSKDGDVKTNQGFTDFWVVKLDANGGIVWEKTFGGADSEYQPAVTACSDGGYVIAGITHSSNSGDVGTNHGNKTQDLLVVKIDANGNKKWSKTIGGSGIDVPSAVIADGDGGCILTGYTNSTDGDVAGRSGADYDLWVAKLDKDGLLGWQTSFGGSGSDYGYGMARLSNGTIAISGSTYSNDRDITANHGSSDVWVTVINSAGKLLWKRSFGSSGVDLNRGIAAGADGAIWVTNSVFGNDGDVSGNHGRVDGWIFKLQ